MEIPRELIGLIGLAHRAGDLVRGTENTLELINKGIIDLVFITEDIGKNTHRQLLTVCNSKEVLLVSMGNSGSWMEDLKLDNRVIGLKKGQLSKNIKKRLGSLDGKSKSC